MRSHYEQQMELLNRSLTEMGELCRAAIDLAALSVTHGHTDAAEKIPAVDAKIDQYERSIESLCMKLLNRQPDAHDLREVSAALKMITDMERIGDQAADIAEIVPFLKGHITKNCALIRDMGEAASRMVTTAVEAYVNRDAGLARGVQQQDDVVDQYFRDIRADLIRVITETPEEVEYALDLLMIAKYFERIGDHATNIAEWVVFSVTGEKENLE